MIYFATKSEPWSLRTANEPFTSVRGQFDFHHLIFRAHRHRDVRTVVFDVFLRDYTSDSTGVKIVRNCLLLFLVFPYTHCIYTVRNTRRIRLRLWPIWNRSDKWQTTTAGIVSSRTARISSSRRTCTPCIYRGTTCRPRNDFRRRTVRSGFRSRTRCCWILAPSDTYTFRWADFYKRFRRTGAPRMCRTFPRNRTNTPCTANLRNPTRPLT